VVRSQDLKYDYTYRPPRYDLPAAVRKQSPIEGLLSPGEKVLWSGQPPRGLLILRRADLFIIPFFVFWTGFACFWELSVLAIFLSGGANVAGPGICMPLFGLPFVAIGLFMLGGRFVGDVLARRRTFYALTDRRVLLVTGLRGQIVTAVPLEKIDNIGMTVHRNGTGTLVFAGSPERAKFGGITYYSGTTGNSSSPLPAFDHIGDPKKVYHLVLKAQEDLTVRQHGYTPEQ
jgi:hypothetical protein